MDNNVNETGLFNSQELFCQYDDNFATEDCLTKYQNEICSSIYAGGNGKD